MSKAKEVTWLELFEQGYRLGPLEEYKHDDGRVTIRRQLIDPKGNPVTFESDRPNIVGHITGLGTNV